ncbi:MAG: energy-coupling factor transporter transmembrane protein EcfT [Clostridia bacterium]|nr:energy-coupling factor transporter transmembrane protein EcfT [Clostridia bacterium]
MLKNVTLGQFFPGDSFLYHVDPRTKLILVIALIVLVFLVKSFAGFALILLLVLWCAISTKVGVKYMLRGLKPMFFIIALTFVLNLFLMREGDDLVHIGFIRITEGGLRTALFMAIRLILLVLCSQILTLTTSPIALTDALEHLLRPLKKIGFPAHEISMMMSIALRFIPTLMEETGKIRRAQMARGADFESGNVLARAKAMIPLLVPLFVSAFRRADELAMAMEARCYRGGDGRTKMKQLKYGWRDAVAACAVVFMFCAVLVINRVLPV